MIPLHDLLPTQRVAYGTRALVALNVVAFVLTAGDRVGAIDVFGAYAYLLSGAPPDTTGLGDAPFAPTGSRSSWEVWRIATHMFMHGDLWHLLGNMWFLWIFGDNVEDRLGHGRYALLYGLAGLVALTAQVLAEPASAVPMVGASGAVAGVLGAYLVLYPSARVVTLVPLGLLPILVHVPAAVFLWIWIGIQVMSAVLDSGPGVAWWAHVGGFFLGMALIRPLAPAQRRVRLRVRTGR